MTSTYIQIQWNIGWKVVIDYIADLQPTHRLV